MLILSFIDLDYKYIIDISYALYWLGADVYIYKINGNFDSAASFLHSTVALKGDNSCCKWELNCG